MTAKSDKQTSIRRIVQENEQHNARLFSQYDPLTGIGSTVAREEIRIDDRRSVFIPVYLARTPVFQRIQTAGSLDLFARENHQTFDACLDFFNKMRICYDFEYWAATCARIKDKKSGKIVPFILRRPQLKLLKVLVDDLFSGRPIRAIVLKARQWGGSTLVQLFYAWIQIFHCINWNSCIVAHQKDQARNVRAMYSRMAQYHPSEVFPVEFQNFEGSQSNRQLKERGAVVSIGSVQNPESLRSDDLKLAHCTEVGLWEDTPKRKAADVIQSVVGSIPDNPFTSVVLESTAKGVGNYFHDTWLKAENGENGYTPVFVAWFEIDLYYRPFHSEKEKYDFASSLTDKELYYFRLGATLEGLNWYRQKRKTMPSDWRMCCEYPSTPIEAFATTGRNVHNPNDIQKMMSQCCDPLYRGELIADAAYGPESLGPSLKFVPSEQGTLRIWKLPDRERRIANRYVVSMDIGGQSEDADWTVIRVIDRYMKLFGGDEECITTWRFHMDQDLAIWKAVQLAEFYNHALFVPELNSIKKHKAEDSDYFYTILDEIVGVYDNIYSRDDPTKIREGVPPRYGFHTNKATKEDLVTQMQRRFRDQLFVENDRRVLEEAMAYEQKADGSYGAADKYHDDLYMATAIGLKVSSIMDSPVEIPQHETPRLRKSGVRTHASF